MPDAAYYRAQATLFRHVARHMTNAEDCRKALAAADLRLARAQELESQHTEPHVIPASPTN